jgi:hypothetical protein
LFNVKPAGTYRNNCNVTFTFFIGTKINLILALPDDPAEPTTTTQSIQQWI